MEGTIQLDGNEYWTSPNMIAFYQTAFEDGNGVYAPSPCWINGYAGNSPACEDTWPVPWAVPIRGWATYDLDSQQVDFGGIRPTVATYALSTVNANGTATYTLELS